MKVFKTFIRVSTVLALAYVCNLHWEHIKDDVLTPIGQSAKLFVIETLPVASKSMREGFQRPTVRIPILVAHSAACDLGVVAFLGRFSLQGNFGPFLIGIALSLLRMYTYQLSSGDEQEIHTLWKAPEYLETESFLPKFHHSSLPYFSAHMAWSTWMATSWNFHVGIMTAIVNVAITGLLLETHFLVYVIASCASVLVLNASSSLRPRHRVSRRSSHVPHRSFRDHI